MEKRTKVHKMVWHRFENSIMESLSCNIIIARCQGFFLKNFFPQLFPSSSSFLLILKSPASNEDLFLFLLLFSTTLYIFTIRIITITTSMINKNNMTIQQSILANNFSCKQRRIYIKKEIHLFHNFFPFNIASNGTRIRRKFEKRESI